jgi:membrane protein DedA with SNARE-associated domain
MHDLMDQVARWGVAFVFLSVFLEQIGLPFPAVPGLLVAGALVQEGRLGVFPVFLAALLASLLADSFWFFLGRKHGYLILKTVCKVSLSPDSCVRQTEALFDRWGLTALLFAKFVPGFSTVAPPLAGAVRTPFFAFLLYDGGGSILWAGSAIAAGIVFHGAVDQVFALLSRIGGGAVFLVAAVFAGFAAVKWWQRRRLFKTLRMARISATELNDLMAAGSKPIVVDARAAAGRTRDGRRIPGAVVLDLDAPESADPGLPLDREIVVYCT